MGLEAGRKERQEDDPAHGSEVRMRWSSKIPSHPFYASIPDQQVPKTLPRKKSNSRHAPPVQPAPVKPLWSNPVSTTQLKRVKSIFINKNPCLWRRKWSGPDCFGSSSSRYSCYLILASSFPAGLCQSGDFFVVVYLFICKEPFWIHPLLYLCVILQCSNTLVLNPSLTTARETTES